MMELDGTDIVEMSMEGEETATVGGPDVFKGMRNRGILQYLLLTPHFDLVVVSTSHQQSAAWMERDSPNRP